MQQEQHYANNGGDSHFASRCITRPVWAGHYPRELYLVFRLKTGRQKCHPAATTRGFDADKHPCFSHFTNAEELVGETVGKSLTKKTLGSAEAMQDKSSCCVVWATGQAAKSRNCLRISCCKVVDHRWMLQRGFICHLLYNLRTRTFLLGSHSHRTRKQICTQTL